MENTIGGASTSTTTPLPAYVGSVNPTLDLIPIYQAANTGTYSISRNAYLALASAPLGLTDSQSPTNKTFNNTNSLTITTANLIIQDSSDNTKQAQFVLSGLTTSTTRSYTLPNYNATLASLTGTETLTNKTLTSPTINAPTITQATISADAISGYTSSTSGTIYGISVSSGTIGSAALAANSVVNAAITTGNLYASKIYNPYKFNAYRANSWTSGNGTYGLVTFDTDAFDTGSNYSVSTGKFTAPVNGYYQFNINVSSAYTGPAYIQLALYKNGSAVQLGPTQYGGGTGTVQVALSMSAFILLSATDYVQVYFYGTGGSGNTGQSTTWFGGYLVCTT